MSFDALNIRPNGLTGARTLLNRSGDSARARRISSLAAGPYMATPLSLMTIDSASIVRQTMLHMKNYLLQHPACVINFDALLKYCIPGKGFAAQPAEKPSSPSPHKEWRKRVDRAVPLRCRGSPALAWRPGGARVIPAAVRIFVCTEAVEGSVRTSGISASRHDGPIKPVTSTPRATGARLGRQAGPARSAI